MHIFGFSLRERLLSKFSTNPTVGFLRAKKETVLRGEGNAWTPVLRSFDKLHEVGFYPTWVLHFI